MKVIPSSESVKNRIEASLLRIINNCGEHLKKQIVSLPIIVTDDKKAEEIYSDNFNLFKKAYSEGFGGVKGNITYNGNKYHLIVLNISNIEKLHLTDQELDGVFSHELGHIFNENPKREMPSILKGNTMNEIDNAKTILLKEAEVYADFFSKLTLTSDGLISSIDKYLASGICLNRDLFTERVEKLNSDEEFIGSLKFVN
ncbi:hypothetical protein HUW51_17425 [Adhaeribacter swui]|uniref:Peptidase M48 domain-containing protein n=1 Tax=Adhaeribacter swui TaxID=2086471 RepID=A0A7G7GB82_9BACT|nr:hypothetical protein [Adhaeribacter swui]QNF34416.1 hypothetical protein HUW51_17425 [Adhaeribacter swui]